MQVVVCEQPTQGYFLHDSNVCMSGAVAKDEHIYTCMCVTSKYYHKLSILSDTRSILGSAGWIAAFPLRGHPEMAV